MGQEIVDRAPNSLSAPMFIFSSESDRVTSNRDHHALFEAVLKHQPKSWYLCLDKALDIHHRMMTKLEGNDYQNLVITLAKAYVESGLTWAELLEIGYQMLLQGKTFEAVVAELNLHQQVSPDMSLIMVMLDKQIVIDAHKHGERG